MLAYHPRKAIKERILAERALELFLAVPGLPWSVAYPAAAYERGACPEQFQQLLKLLSEGKSFGDARKQLAPLDTQLPPASEI